MDHSIIGPPSPFLFNTYKHHFEFIREFIHQAKNQALDEEEVKSIFLKMGRLMIDLYHGNLTPVNISDEIKKHLESIACFEENRYTNFILKSPKKYKTIGLSDGSNWTLLVGRDYERYIHLHPSRGSKHTIRIKAIALKTAICIKVFYDQKLSSNNLVEIANEIRIKYLDEAPIKNEIYTKGLRRVLNLF